MGQHNVTIKITERRRESGTGQKMCPIPLGVSTQVCTPCGHVSYIPFLCLVGSNPEKITDLSGTEEEIVVWQGSEG